MGKLFNKVLAGVSLGTAFMTTASMVYYYEKLAFAKSAIGAIIYAVGIVYCCIMYSVFSGEES